MPCLESGNFDVNSCIDGVMMADQRTRKDISVQNTFSKVGDYMIYKCACLVCCPGWFMYMSM